MVNSYRDLRVWQEAIKLVRICYQATRLFPPHEIYGLTQQIQRAAVSVPANIAEGNGRDHTKDYLRHLSIAHGSLMELETHAVIARELGYISSDVGDPVMEQAAIVGRLLNALKKSLRKRLQTMNSQMPSPDRRSPIPDPRSLS